MIFIKSLFLTIGLFISTDILAIEVTLNGISYDLNLSTRTAAVSSSTLENVIVPETVYYDDVTYNVTSIAKTAFCNNNIIKTFKSSSIKEIQGYETSYGYYDGEDPVKGAFASASNLVEVYMDNIEKIGAAAFYNNTNLKKIFVGNSLKQISELAFSYCTSLKYIVIPSSITKINLERGDNAWHGILAAFAQCPQLTIICLNEGFTCVRAGSFTSPNDLPQTVYPSSFFSLGANVFEYSGIIPSVDYTFNGIGFGFKPTNVDMSTLSITAGSHTTNINFTISNDDMSFKVDIPYTYTINPAKLTSKVKDASRLYGDSNPQFISEYSGFVNNEDASVVTSNGNYTTTATEKSDVGTYAIKQSGATAQNYVFEYEDGTLTVNKAPLTMTANDKTMTYGGTIPTLDASYEGLKNNETQPAWSSEPSFSTTATSVSKVGTYPISISNADAKNYQLTVNNGTLTVNKAELTVIPDNKNRIYGDANPDFTLSFSGLKNNETVPEWEKQPTIETTSNVTSPVGTYPIIVKDAVAVNYNITAKDGMLTVNKAELQITPNDATRKYGEENPNFKLAYVGLKNNENTPEWTVEPVITTNATKTSSVGDYAIQVTSAEARNYTLNLKAGILTITKAPLTISVKNCTRRYGDANPTFEFAYDGLLNDENAPEWTKFPSITTEATEKSDVGEYAIVATDGEMKNYETNEIKPGVLTVTPASLTVRANDTSRLYFEDNPEFTFSCIGFIGNDDTSTFTKMPTMKTNATKNSTVGVYVIEVGEADSKNYTLSYEKGQLTINKRQLIVSTKNYTRAYGEDNPDFELLYNGFVNNEDENVLFVKPKATTTATSTSDVGEYDIIVSNGVAENYDFQYANAKLIIEKAYQTLTWDQDLNDVKQYDQVELTAEATSGLEVTYTVEGSQICSITRIGKKVYLDCTGVGEAVIVAIQEGNNNYWQTTKIYKKIVISGSKDVISGHEFVDLGLPSGKLWAKTNFGATSESQYGNYINWQANDIVTLNWGNDWGTPSNKDFEELFTTCTWTWSNKNSVDGYIVTGPNGKSMFLPAAGFLMMGTPQMEGSGIYYWTITPSSDSSFAYMLSGNSSSVTPYVTFNTSVMSAPIRPVVLTQLSGISGLVIEESASDVYDLNGAKKQHMQKGINIVRMSNGKLKKVLVK